jgi:type I restriction-modification system DNA methylase subunit
METEMTHKQEIIKTIQSISGRYSPYNIFTDWIECSALAIQNTCSLPGTSIWKKREQEYKDIMNRYELNERIKLREMFFMLVDTLEEETSDVLGEIYMQSGMGSKYTGQFFTPFHLSELTAKLSLAEIIRDFDGTAISLNEPSCGGGGMIIAAAKVMKEAGINPQKYLRIVAQDLDWKGVYMTYLQLSLLGLKAKVVQGNTLMEPYHAGYPPERILKTPAEMGVLI